MQRVFQLDIPDKTRTEIVPIRQEFMSVIVRSLLKLLIWFKLQASAVVTAFVSSQSAW